MGKAPYDIWEIERYGRTIKMNVCPLPKITQKTNDSIMFFDNYKKGLPYKPTLSFYKQPAYFIDLVQTLQII